MSSQNTAKQLCVSYLVGAIMADFGRSDWMVSAAKSMSALAASNNVTPEDFTTYEDGENNPWVSVKLSGKTYKFKLNDLDNAIKTEIKHVQSTYSMSLEEAREIAGAFARSRLAKPN